MKSLICLILLVCFCLPVLAARPYTEKEINDILQELFKSEDRAKFLSEQYANCEAENLKMQLIINRLKMDLKEETEIGKIAKYGLLFFGIWGVSTGGLYPFITGSLFLWGAIK